jgi:hypothetical protein
MLWLTINMRLLHPELSPDQREQQEIFANRILAVDDGRKIGPNHPRIE